MQKIIRSQLLRTVKNGHFFTYKKEIFGLERLEKFLIHCLNISTPDIQTVYHNSERWCSQYCNHQYYRTMYTSIHESMPVNISIDSKAK